MLARSAAALGAALLAVPTLGIAPSRADEPAAGTPPAPPPRYAPDTAWTGTILEEDDFWAPQNKDRHYTHGIRFSATSGDVVGDFWRAPFDWLGDISVFPKGDGAPGGELVSRRYNLIPLGQNMYTPQDPTRFTPDPRDRPYAGWLYGGVGMMQDTPGSGGATDGFDDIELKLGIVGPGSLAHATQTRFHLLIDVQPFQGWHAQIPNEWTGDLFYQHKWRYHAETDSGWGWDALPQWDIRAGNVYDYLGAGGLLRIGRNLRGDWGPPHIDLNTGADYINPTRFTAGDWGAYLFAGGEARAVGHNIFLDGNDFEPSAHVRKIPAVGDAIAGVAFLWGHYRLAYTYVYRSPEFFHQDGPDHYGSLNLTVNLRF